MCGGLPVACKKRLVKSCLKGLKMSGFITLLPLASLEVLPITLLGIIVVLLILVIVMFANKKTRHINQPPLLVQI